MAAAAAVGDVLGVVAQVACDEDDSTLGFQVVRSRKHGMRRRHVPQAEMPVEKVNVNENEVPWLTIVGSRPRRRARKCHQDRKGGTIMSSKGLGFFVYGSHGPDGLEF